MKLEEYECVKTKRRAQARIYKHAKDLTPEQLVAHYQRPGEAARQRQAELRACSESADQLATLSRQLDPFVCPRSFCTYARTDPFPLLA